MDNAVRMLFRASKTEYLEHQKQEDTKQERKKRAKKPH